MSRFQPGGRARTPNLPRLVRRRKVPHVWSAVLWPHGQFRREIVVDSRWPAGVDTQYVPHPETLRRALFSHSDKMSLAWWRLSTARAVRVRGVDRFVPLLES